MNFDSSNEADRFRRHQRPPYFRELYEKSGSEKFGLTFADFTAILEEITARYLPGESAAAESAKLHHSLRIEELALARACATGSEPAWECFVDRYRQKLYDIAGAIARDESAGRELADSLYADLFGTQNAEGHCRLSKLASYTGRGSLEGWLRTVLAQQYVNQYRSRRKFVAFDEQIRSENELTTKQTDSGTPADLRLEQATDAALLSLSNQERIMLASYYLDGRTLAEIGRMLALHESTVSRRIEKITKILRDKVVRGLRKRGMSKKEAEETRQSDVRQLDVDVRARLAQEKIK